MKISFRQVAVGVCGPLAIVFVVTAAGCRQFAAPSVSSLGETATKADAAPTDPFTAARTKSPPPDISPLERQMLGFKLNDKGELADAGDSKWRLLTDAQRNASGPSKVSTAMPLRWSHPGLDAVMSASADPRPSLNLLASSKNEVVAASAIIGLGRVEPGKHNERLFEVASRNVMPLPTNVRCAAIETLALAGPAAQPQLDTLWQQSEWLSAPQAAAVNAAQAQAASAIAAELVHVRLRKGNLDADDKIIAAALKHPSEPLRLSVLKELTKAKAKPSDAVVDLAVAKESLAVQLAALELFETTAKDSDALGSTKRGFIRRHALLPLLDDRNPRVRVSALRIFSTAQDPAAHEKIVEAMQSSELSERLAAVECLGLLANDEAKETLKKLCVDQPELVREAAVKGLLEVGEVDSVLASAGDDSWRVRRVVAQSFARTSSPVAQAAAAKFVVDSNTDVRAATLAGVESWPATAVMPILFPLLAAPDAQVAAKAAELLSANWPEAEFPEHGTRDQRKAAAERLRAEWVSVHGQPAPPAQGEPANVQLASAETPLAESAPPPTEVSGELPAREMNLPQATNEQIQVIEELMAALDEGETEEAAILHDLQQFTAPVALDALESLAVQRGRVYREAYYVGLFVKLDDAFASVEELRRNEASDPVSLAARRDVAQRLAQRAAAAPLPALAVRRLAEVSAGESDAAVWQKLLDAITTSTGEPAERLRAIALGHEAGGVRLAACKQFHAAPRPRHAPILRTALIDQDPAVVRLAADALGQIGPLDDTTELEALLTHADANVQVTAALALARLGSSSGPVALERLARHRDEAVRIQTAKAIGTLHDARFHPEQYNATLVSMLSDRPSVQRTAQESLAAINKTASLPESSSSSILDRSRAWRDWYSTQR